MLKFSINIKDLENFRVSDKGELYKLPYIKDNRSYSLRKIKVQYPDRWILNGKAWTKKQLKPHLVRLENPIIINIEDYPF